MNRKFILAVFIFSFFLSFSFSNVGLGGSFSYVASTSPHMQVSFTAKSDHSPWTVFFNAHLKENTISVFADDWFINERIAEHLDYFVLWGISAGATFEDDKTIIATGCRFGAGLDFFFLKRSLEFFAQSVWNPYFGIKKKNNDCSAVFKPITFPCTAGIRFWF